MREIKFREWDKHREEIYGKGSGMSYGEREDFDDMVGWRFSHEESLGEEPRVLMQFTGLKDTNGIEIFENDIVRVMNFLGNQYNCVVYFGKYEQDGSGGEYEGSFCYGFYLRAVDPKAETLEDGFYRRIVLETDIETSILHYDVIEVIGNRFENPELLKEG